MTLCSVARHGGPRPQATSRTAARTSPNASGTADFSRLLRVSHCAEPVGVALNTGPGNVTHGGPVDRGFGLDSVPFPVGDFDRREHERGGQETLDRPPRVLGVAPHETP